MRISAVLKPYHEHNAAVARPKILERLAQGAAIALVSDAGTPLISDPGFKLVREVTAAGHQVIALPGPSSVLAALAVAALPTDRFFFEGFLPSKQTARRSRLSELQAIDATLVMFESGNRIQETLHDLAEIIGNRDAAICRELTKLHEEISRAPLTELAGMADTLETRGEFVLVIGPPAADAQVMAAGDLDELLRASLQTGSVKDAVAHAVEISGRPRREIYARALELAGQARKEDRDGRRRCARSTKAAAQSRRRRRASPRSSTGVSAEGRAAAYLMVKGYRILARRFRTPYGEIDIVAKRRNLIAFVEVKARASARRGRLCGDAAPAAAHHRGRARLG